MQDLYERARKIRVAVFDVDGVLTDGALYYADSGAEMKAFSVHDGHGIRMLGESGVAAAIISSRSSGALESRARNLGIQLLYQGAADKLAAFTDLLGRCGVGAEACVYVGDDLVDVPVLRRCGFACSPREAPEQVRQCAHYICSAPAGGGAVRELCEFIMRAQGTLERQLREYDA